MNIFDDVESKEELLGQLAGAVSMCWTDIRLAGEFMSREASHYVDDALDKLDELLDQQLD